MAVFQVTETIKVKVTIKDDAGNLVDPTTSTTITITDPAGTKVVDVQALTKNSVGSYQYLYTTLAAAVLGSYYIRIIATDVSRLTIADSEFVLVG